jgi:hypothetical protein
MNESAPLIYDEITGVKKVMGDLYEITAEDFIDSEGTPPFGVILVTKDIQKSICLSFFDFKGKQKTELWIPKEAIDIEKKQNDYIITIDPDKEWFSKDANMNLVDDFIEDLYDCKMRDKLYDSSAINTVKEDVISIMDILDIECNIRDIKKISDNNEYEVTLDNDIFIEIKKRNSNDLIGEFKFYVTESSSHPSFEIKSMSDKILLSFYLDDAYTTEEESDISNINKDPKLNYLLKKSLNLSTNTDKERLYDYFCDYIKSNNWVHNNEIDAKTEALYKERSKKLKELKKIISSFVSSEKIEKVYPSNI